MRISKTKEFYARELQSFEQQEATHSSLQYHLDLVLESFEKGDYETVIFHLNRAWELDPDDTRAILMRARVYLIVKDYDNAKSDINFVLYLEPDNEDALKLKEKILKKSDDFRKFRAFPIYS